jgi:hypothetical protein
MLLQIYGEIKLRNFMSFTKIVNLTKFTPTFIFSGELENWWEQNTEDQYKAKAQCIIDQEPLL